MFDGSFSHHQPNDVDGDDGSLSFNLSSFHALSGAFPVSFATVFVKVKSCCPTIMKSWFAFAFILSLTTLLDRFCDGFCPQQKIPSLLSLSSSPTRTATATTTTKLAMSTVVDEPVTIDKTDKDTTAEKAAAGTKLPAFLLRLWNDPYNKREFVARCLAEVCGKSDTESFQIMMHAHQQGMGIIGQYDFEIAELYLQSLKERNLLVDMIPVEGECCQKKQKEMRLQTPKVMTKQSSHHYTLSVDC